MRAASSSNSRWAFLTRWFGKYPSLSIGSSSVRCLTFSFWTTTTSPRLVLTKLNSAAAVANIIAARIATRLVIDPPGRHRAQPITLPPRIRDRQPRHFNVVVATPHPLAIRGREPGMDELHHVINRDAMGQEQP